MKGDLCLLDQHQRSHYDISLRHDHDWTRGNDELGSTVEQQPVGKLVQQSCGEVQRTAFSQLTQPKPKPICDRSKKPDDTEDVFVVKGETFRSHEIDEQCLHEELVSSDRSGKPDNLSENIRVKHAHDGTGQLVEQNSSSAHTGKEQFAPEENRDIASFNTDNEFNRAINEENIERSRTTLSDKHFKVIFNNIERQKNACGTECTHTVSRALLAIGQPLSAHSFHSLSQKVRGREVMEIKILGVRKLRERIV